MNSPPLPGGRPLLAAAAVTVVAVVLRWPIVSPALVLETMRVDLSLSRATAGLLMSIPLLMFGLAAPLGARAGRRWGDQWALVTALVVIGAGIVLRSVGGAPTVALGVVVLGLGVAVGNVLTPAVVKAEFRPDPAPMTATYTASLTAGAGLGSAVTALLLGAGWSWRPALASSVVLALATAGLVAALAATGPQSRSDAVPPSVRLRWWRRPAPGPPGALVVITTYFTCQTVLFFGLSTWMPARLQDVGTSVTVTGHLLSLFNFLGIPGALMVPLLVRSRFGLVAGASGAGVCWAAGVVCFALAPGFSAGWVVLLGITQGTGISMTFVLISRVTRSAGDAREMGARVQTVGYVVAAAAPVTVGALRTAAGGWTVPLLALSGVALVMTLAGWRLATKHGEPSRARLVRPESVPC